MTEPPDTNHHPEFSEDDPRWQQASEFFDDVIALFDNYSKHLYPLNEKMEARDMNRAAILQCHLVLEHVIDKVLKHELPRYNAKKLRLRFAQKVDMLPVKDKMYASFIPGMKEVGRVRNRYAHDLEVELTDAMLPKIGAYIKQHIEQGSASKKEQERLEDTAYKVAYYCRITIGFMLLYTEDVSPHVLGFLNKYPKLKRWLGGNQI